MQFCQNDTSMEAPSRFQWSIQRISLFWPKNWDKKSTTNHLLWSQRWDLHRIRHCIVHTNTTLSVFLSVSRSVRVLFSRSVSGFVCRSVSGFVCRSVGLSFSNPNTSSLQPSNLDDSSIWFTWAGNPTFFLLKKKEKKRKENKEKEEEEKEEKEKKSISKIKFILEFFCVNEPPIEIVPLAKNTHLCEYK